MEKDKNVTDTKWEYTKALKIILISTEEQMRKKLDDLVLEQGF